MTSQESVTEMLDASNVIYRVFEHEKVNTSQELAKSQRVSLNRVAKVVVVIADGEPVNLILPANRKVSISKLKDILASDDVKLATESQIAALFDNCEVGAIPPLDLWDKAELIMDPAMNVEGDIVFHGGKHSEGVKMNFRDWFWLTMPEVGDFSVPKDPSPLSWH